MFNPFGSKSISVTEASERLGTSGHCLLDVRTKEEFKELSAPGALNIPLDRLESEAHQLAGYSSIFVMCRSGGRSAMATSLLHRLGIPQATNVAGGMLAWKAAGLPIQ